MTPSRDGARVVRKAGGSVYAQRPLFVLRPPAPVAVRLVGRTTEVALLVFQEDLIRPSVRSEAGDLFAFARLGRRVAEAGETKEGVKRGLALIHDFAARYGPLHGHLTATLEGIASAPSCPPAFRPLP